MPTLDDLTSALRQFVADRDWRQFHDPKNLAMLVASEAGELLAEYRWVRGDAADAWSREPAARARIADEIADVGIALLLLCDRIGLDLPAAMQDKLAKNAARYPIEASRGRAERPDISVRDPQRVPEPPAMSSGQLSWPALDASAPEQAKMGARSMAVDDARAIQSWIDDPTPLALRCGVQHYAWGQRAERALIPRLLGQPPEPDKPYAELWIGAHPGLPAETELGTRRIGLPTLIGAAPDVVLGRASVETFGRELPFLMKVLTAARALSIQAHPSRALAEEGFAREDAAGIPRAAPERNYRDRNHKPELIIALDDFFALDGFRPASEIAASWQTTPELAPLLDGQYDGDEAAWLRRLFERCMREPAAAAALQALLGRLSREARERPWPRDRVEHWLLAAARDFARPGAIDRGLFAFLLLNFVHLGPGQALFLGAGRLHAYLEGDGVEVMANSDNVLRGGLTPKHVDVPELMRVLTFEGAPARVLEPDERGVYATPATEFQVASIPVLPAARYRPQGTSGATLLLVIEGQAEVIAGRHRLPLPAGQPALVPAALADYQVEATAGAPARLFRVSIPGAP